MHIKASMSWNKNGHACASKHSTSNKSNNSSSISTSKINATRATCCCSFNSNTSTSSSNNGRINNEDKSKINKSMSARALAITNRRTFRGSSMADSKKIVVYHIDSSNRKDISARSAVVASNASPKGGGKVHPVSEKDFTAEVLDAEVPVLVDFWAQWCGPCKLIDSVVGWAQDHYGKNLKVVKIETDPNPSLVERYKVYGLPTIVIFKDGKVVEGSKREGAITIKQLEDYLKKYDIKV